MLCFLKKYLLSEIVRQWQGFEFHLAYIHLQNEASLVHHGEAHRQPSCSLHSLWSCFVHVLSVGEMQEEGGEMRWARARPLIQNTLAPGSASPASSAFSAEPRPAGDPMASPTHDVSFLCHRCPMDGCGHNPMQNDSFFLLGGKMHCKSSLSLPLIEAWKLWASQNIRDVLEL